ALDGVIADRRVVVGQLLARIDVARGADPDRGVDDFDPAVRRAGVVDEARDVAADGGVAAPAAVDAEDPDAALLQVARLARAAAAVRNQLARVIDDAAVLVDGLGGEDAVPVQVGSTAHDLGQLDVHSGDSPSSRKSYTTSRRLRPA